MSDRPGVTSVRTTLTVNSLFKRARRKNDTLWQQFNQRICFSGEDSVGMEAGGGGGGGGFGGDFDFGVDPAGEISYWSLNRIIKRFYINHETSAVRNVKMVLSLQPIPNWLWPCGFQWRSSAIVRRKRQNERNKPRARKKSQSQKTMKRVS